MNNEQMIEAYKQYLEANNYAAGTILNYVCQATRFLEGGYSLDLEGAEKFAIEKRRNTPAAQNTLLRQIKMFFVWLSRGGIVDRATIAFFPTSPRTSTKMPRVTSESDIELLLANTATKYHLPILLMFYLGLRETELINLDWLDFDFQNKTFVITRKGGGEQLMHYDVNPRLVELVDKHSKPSGPLMTGRFADDTNQTRITQSGFYKVISRASKAAGIEHVYPHAVRHGFACRSMSRGVNLSIIRDTLGHKSLNTTWLYLRGLRNTSEAIRDALKED